MLKQANAMKVETSREIEGPAELGYGRSELCIEVTEEEAGEDYGRPEDEVSLFMSC